MHIPQRAVARPLDARAAHLKDPDPETALRSVREDLVEHAEGPLHDDAAMLLVRHWEDR